MQYRNGTFPPPHVRGTKWVWRGVISEWSTLQRKFLSNKSQEISKNKPLQLTESKNKRSLRTNASYAGTQFINHWNDLTSATFTVASANTSTINFVTMATHLLCFPITPVAFPPSFWRGSRVGSLWRQNKYPGRWRACLPVERWTPWRLELSVTWMV